jgi:hypothetical protein
MKQAIAFFILLTASGPALAQQAADNVTVTGARLRAEVERYLGSVSINSAVAGKIARWERNAICPVVVGLKPEYVSFLTARIRAVAQEIGAPVDASPQCRPNIRIVFTTTPQALLDNVRKNHSGLLGYTRTNREADRVAQVLHPVQGWYRTQTVGDRGLGKRDVRVIGMCTDPFSPECPNAFDVQSLSVGNNIKSRFEDVTIVADPVKLGNPEMGALGDLVAMMALSQPQLGKGCQNSVLDLIARACPNPPNGFSPMDMSYLRGLYRMRGTAVGTRDPIASWMVKNLTEK